MRNRDAFDSEFKAIRPAVIERDRSRCVKCGYGASLEVHHVNGYGDCQFEMLRTLCYFCHGVAPLGDEYWVWERSGRDGWESAVDFIVENTPGTSAEMVLGVLRSIDPLLDQWRKADSSNARRGARKATGRCEGQKPFGHHPAEVAALRFIREKAALGDTPTGIARMLNAEAIPSRRGTKWYPMVVSRILAAQARAKAA